MINPGELIQLVSSKGKRYLRIFDPDQTLHTHDGKIEFKQIAALDFGDNVKTHLDKEYRILKPTIYDLIKGVQRKTQIIYPKDIGYILLKLNIGPGGKVIEAGSGSGSLTLALAWFVGSQGKVYSYELRSEFCELCAQNLERVGLRQRVELVQQDISQGFPINDAQACFLDLRTPWEFLEQISQALHNGAPVGFLLPTMNQVSALIEALEKSYFTDLEIVELLLRKYKPNSARMRPEDRMVAHTGYLIFARIKKRL